MGGALIVSQEKNSVYRVDMEDNGQQTLHRWASYFYSTIFESM